MSRQARDAVRLVAAREGLPEDPDSSDDEAMHAALAASVTAALGSTANAPQPTSAPAPRWLP